MGFLAVVGVSAEYPADPRFRFAGAAPLLFTTAPPVAADASSTTTAGVVGSWAAWVVDMVDMVCVCVCVCMSVCGCVGAQRVSAGAGSV